MAENKSHIERGMSFTLDDGKTYVVSSGDNQRQMTMTPKEAINRAKRKGELGIGFDTPKQADEYATMRSRKSESSFNEMMDHYPGDTLSTKLKAMKRMSEE